MSGRGPRGGGGDWVPLFIPTTGQLATSINVIEPTPRRSRFDRGQLRSDGSEVPLSPTDSETSLDNYITQHAQSPGLLQPPAMVPFRMPSHDELEQDEALSSAVSARSSPRLAQVTGFFSSTMQRTASATSTALSRVGSLGGMGGHARRRSNGSTEMHSILNFPEYAIDETAEEERKRGLRRMMGEQLRAEQDAADQNWSHIIKLFLAVVAFGLLIPLSQVALDLGSVGALTKAVGGAVSGASQSLKMNDAAAEVQLSGVAKSHAGEWWQALPAAIYNHFETVAYPISTHPRTPTEDDDVPFPTYLATRLGSHFGVPSSGATDPAGMAASQLWLTTATAETVNLATRHLRAYVAELDKKGELSTDKVRLRDGKDLYARRELVVICLDEGCLASCRKDAARFCFGGFAGEDERRAKRMATIEALESGRRVFIVDKGIYFKPDADPVKYLAPFKQFDIQIPEFWTTSMEHDAGFAVFNPTQAVISLFYRIEEISRLPRLERESWASTNLLLDPNGAARSRKGASAGAGAGAGAGRTQQQQESDEDEGLYHDEAISAGYGQAEFESAWGGGLDVKVLSRVRFRESTGKLDELKGFKAGKAIFFHCECCGDPENVDYIAGALGYHHPSVLYPQPNEKTGYPDLPLALRTQGLSGTAEELSFAVSVLLQLTADSGRTFVPPLKVSLEKENKEGEVEAKEERYWWRVFPVQKWNSLHLAHTDDDAAVGGVLKAHVREPSFIVHAIEHFRKHFSASPYAVAAVLELETPTLFDLAPFDSYEDALQELERGVLGSTRVVEVEGWDSVRGREGWKKLHQRKEEVEMCVLDQGEKSLKLDSGSCEILCVRGAGAKEDRRARRWLR